MQYVVPYLSHRIKTRDKAAGVVSLDQVPDSEFSLIIEKTLEASPAYAGLVKLYQKHGKWDRHTIKLRYLLRDTLKVVGSRALGLAPAACGIFYVNESSPLSGGTGPIIKVCRKNNVLWRIRKPGLHGISLKGYPCELNELKRLKGSTSP